MDRDALRDWFTRGRIITLGVVVVLLLAAVLTARPAWRALKTWRAHRFTAEGEALLAKDQLEPALQRARQAVQLSGTDARSQRLMSRVLTRGAHAQAVPFWAQLLKNPEATASDREEAIIAGLRARAWDFVREQLQIVLARPPVMASTYRLASDYYAAQGDFKQGVNFARQALRAEPADGTNILFVAQRLLLTRTEAETAEARQLLDQHGAAPVPTGADALVLLAMRFNNSAAQMETIIQRLRDHPAHTPAQEFLALDLELKIKPDQWDRIVAGAGQKYGGGDDEMLLQLGRWFNRHKEFDEVVRHIPLERALKSQALYLVHLDALAALKRWAEVEKALDSTSAPLEQFYVMLYKVRAQIEQGRSELAGMNWTVIHQRARDNAEQMLYLAQYTEKLGIVSEAVRAYQRLVELLPNNRAALIALLQLVEKHGSTSDIRDAVGLIVRQFPEDTAAQNDFAYYSALLGQNLEAGQQVGEMLVRAQPDMLAYRVTLALGWLRAGRGAEAVQLLKPLKVDWTQARPGWQAVFAATLLAGGDAEAASRIVERIPANSLRPEEAALINALAK